MRIAGSLLRLRLLRLALLLCTCSGCIVVPANKHYQGPTPRPSFIEQYYNREGMFIDATDTIIEEDTNYTLRRITLQTAIGETVVDYRQLPEKNDDLIFVLPVLGGRNDIAEYFVEYFADHGFDTALVHRDSEFKNPDNFPIIEDLFRNNVVRDRIVMDYFEEHYQKKDFGSFGISRGAINAATTAGIDARLKYNVLALGATDVIGVLRSSEDAAITRFREKIMEQQDLDEAGLKALLESEIHTSPEAVAQHLDARNTLVFLALLDKTVPFYYGYALKEQIGSPETIYIFADHFTALLYTQFVPLILPYRPLAIFPYDYIETKALSFYEEKFERDTVLIKMWPITLYELPFRAIGWFRDLW